MLSEPGSDRRPEHIRLDGGARVVPDDLRQRVPVVDAVRAEDVGQSLVVAVVEAVAVAQRLELPGPDRELGLAHLGTGHVRLGEDADEPVDVVHGAVDGLEPGRQRGPPGTTSVVRFGSPG